MATPPKPDVTKGPTKQAGITSSLKPVSSVPGRTNKRRAFGTPRRMVRS